MFKARYLLSAALAPAVLLFFYIRKKDKIEPEPLKMLLLLALFGAIATIPAGIIEIVVSMPFSMILGEESPIYSFIECFFIIAVAEEGLKFLILLWRTWRSPEFNYTYDAVVYSVSVSLGFAALENVLYVFQNGFGTAILRALTAVPGHTIFAVFMGCYYGMAKKAHCYGDTVRKTTGMILAIAVPVLIHGFYDFCLSVGSWIFVILFFVFEIVITILAILKVRKLSREDSPVSPYAYSNMGGSDIYPQ